MTTRPALDMPFDPPKPLPDDSAIAGTEQTPAFYTDCATIFLSIDLTAVKFP